MTPLDQYRALLRSGDPEFVTRGAIIRLLAGQLREALDPSSYLVSDQLKQQSDARALLSEVQQEFGDETA